MDGFCRGSRRSAGGWLLLGSLLAALCSPAPVRAGEEIAAQQAKVLLRVLAYDRKLESRVGEDLVIGVIYLEDNPASRAAKDNMVAAFTELSAVSVKGLPMSVQPLAYTSINPLKNRVALLGIDLLFLAPGLFEPLDEIIAFTRLVDVSTCSSVQSYIKRGVSIGVVPVDGKAKLFINLPGSKEEGMDISAEVLRLAEVFK